MVAIALALRDPALRARLNGWTVFCAGLVVLFLMTQAVAVVGSVDKTLDSGESKSSFVLKHALSDTASAFNGSARDVAGGKPLFSWHPGGGLLMAVYQAHLR